MKSPPPKHSGKQLQYITALPNFEATTVPLCHELLPGSVLIDCVAIQLSREPTLAVEAHHASLSKALKGFIYRM